MTKGVSAKQQHDERLRLRRKRLQDASGALQGAKSRRAEAAQRGRPCWKVWRSRIYIDGKNRHLGYFESQEEAQAAYAAAVKAHLGERYLKAGDRL
jgi:hypothetical protein